jgi:hypothetical protein
MGSIYSGEAAKLLNVCASKLNEWAEQGLISSVKLTATSRRSFDRDEIMSFKQSPAYLAIGKGKALAFICASTQQEEKLLTRNVNQYCEKLNLKVIIITQLNKGHNEINNEAYNRAVNLFHDMQISTFIYAGDTRDIRDLTRMFSAVSAIKVLNAKTDLKLEAKASAFRESFGERASIQSQFA